MKTWFRLLRGYLLVSLLALLVGALALMFSSKVAFHVWINSTHTPLQDGVFSYLTHLGGGTFVVAGTLVLILVYWKRYGVSIFLFGILNLLLVVVSTQFLKLVVFADALRPTAFITETVLHTAPGVEMHTYNSFPSGHTAAGFAFFGFVAFLHHSKYWLQLLCALMAVLIGYSRIYLSQHFLEDAVVGGAIGLLCVSLSYVAASSMKVGKRLQ